MKNIKKGRQYIYFSQNNKQKKTTCFSQLNNLYTKTKMQTKDNTKPKSLSNYEKEKKMVPTSLQLP